MHHYKIDQFECVQPMAKLERLKCFYLEQNLAAKEQQALISQKFQWIPNGPLAKYMEKNGIATFMASSFTGENSFRFYIRGTYTQTSISLIERKLNQLKKEVALLNQEDALLPVDNRQDVGLLFAMRPWEMPQFNALRRN